MTQRPRPLSRNPSVVLAASVTMPDAADAPDWVHLLPTARGAVETFDGRGPYEVTDLAAVIQASMAWERGIPIDENHATDLRPGLEAPARGWIKELQARADGLWGRVEWTAAGRALVADKAYRGISPVLMLNADERTVRLIPRASLVNIPNLRGLTALNMEMPMEGLSKIAEKLGLEPDATLDQILATIGSMSDKAKPDAALQSALTEIGTALGVDGSNPAAVLAAAKVVKAGGADVVALQSQVTTLQTQLTALETGAKRTAAEAYIDGEMAKGRTGITTASREALITLHMSAPDQAVAIVGAQPVVTPTAIVAGATPPGAVGEVHLNAEQRAACEILGLSEEAFLKTLKEEKR